MKRFLGRNNVAENQGERRRLACSSARPRAEHERIVMHHTVGSFCAQGRGARARPTAPEAGALPILTVSFRLIILAVWITCLASALGQGSNTVATSVSFNTVDVFVDSGAEALAAYQLDFDAKAGGVRIVGIEGGSHPAFNESPHFDPKAIQQDRVILAAFNTATREKLPTGRTRVATIHLMVTGTRAAEFEVKLTAAGTAGGKRISAKASIEENEPK